MYLFASIGRQVLAHSDCLVAFDRDRLIVSNLASAIVFDALHDIVADLFMGVVEHKRLRVFLCTNAN